jgi:hypothetical protein
VKDFVSPGADMTRKPAGPINQQNMDFHSDNIVDSEDLAGVKETEKEIEFKPF